MRGHEQLIAARKAGKKPRFVFVNDWDCPTTWFEDGDAYVTICTAGDDVALIDVRFLVGLRVSVSSESEARARALFDRCKAAGASVVAACHVQPGRAPWQQNGWAKVWHAESETA